MPATHLHSTARFVHACMYAGHGQFAIVSVFFFLRASTLIPPNGNQTAYKGTLFCGSNRHECRRHGAVHAERSCSVQTSVNFSQPPPCHMQPSYGRCLWGGKYSVCLHTQRLPCNCLRSLQCHLSFRVDPVGCQAAFSFTYVWKPRLILSTFRSS